MFSDNFDFVKGGKLPGTHESCTLCALKRDFLHVINFMLSKPDIWSRFQCLRSYFTRKKPYCMTARSIPPAAYPVHGVSSLGGIPILSSGGGNPFLSSGVPLFCLGGTSVLGPDLGTPGYRPDWSTPWTESGSRDLGMLPPTTQKGHGTRPETRDWGISPLLTDTHLWKQYLPVVLRTRTVTIECKRGIILERHDPRSGIYDFPSFPFHPSRAVSFVNKVKWQSLCVQDSMVVLEAVLDATTTTVVFHPDSCGGQTET